MNKQISKSDNTYMSKKGEKILFTCTYLGKHTTNDA
jgi:hypothetical protein